MTETCARCGHSSGGCQRCGRHDDDLGANINSQDYCHNADGETCYTVTSLHDWYLAGLRHSLGGKDA